MSAIALFGRARRWRTNVIVFIIVGALIVLCGPVYYALNPNGGYLVSIAAQLPLIPAVVIQATSLSPMAAQEGQASRPLRKYQAFNYLILTAAAAVPLGIAAYFYTPLAGEEQTGGYDLGPITVIRNLIALIGAGFIGASLIGASLGWVIPAAWAILPYVLLTATSSDNEFITLVVQPDDSFNALAIASVVWLIGLVAASGTRRGALSLESIGRRLRLRAAHHVGIRRDDQVRGSSRPGRAAS
ncbi:hypothetical protein [Clavibacter nebraskensis]|uniref:hypothetical protein n=1 Tax=Clavibacter nebraskensis TaxID=31963 RepID=UPI003F4CADE5